MLPIRAGTISVTAGASTPAATDRTMMEHRMADGNLPDIETLRKMLAYDPGTGSLTWRHRPASMFSDGKQSAEHNAAAWNGRYAGMGAFETPHRDGYRQGAIFGRKWQAMIWLYGRGKSLGYFTDFDSAVASRKAAEAEFGFHPNHGRPQ